MILGRRKVFANRWRGRVVNMRSKVIERTAAISPGVYLDGGKLKDGLSENIQYLELKFLDPTEVALGEEFQAILPILWAIAGSAGRLKYQKNNGLVPPRRKALTQS